tara:strand:- start:1701 stop:2372 length:672 start_codon:yes stop_codon:yes gene_type:complete
MKKFIGFIPARGGSIRIPNKNLKLYKNKPLIFYSINASKKSKHISETVVFSNSKKINLKAKKYGAIINYKRPNNKSKSNTSMFETLDYFINKNNLKKKYDYVVLLQPTSPLRNFKDIDNACKLILSKKKADGLVSTFLINNIKKNYPDKFMVEKKGYLKKISRINIKYFKKLYLRNGPAIFIIKIGSIKKNLYNIKLINYVMPEKKSIDINTYDDLKALKKFK